jgi:hypothetical protein
MAQEAQDQQLARGQALAEFVDIRDEPDLIAAVRLNHEVIERGGFRSRPGRCRRR